MDLDDGISRGCLCYDVWENWEKPGSLTPIGNPATDGRLNPPAPGALGMFRVVIRESYHANMGEVLGGMELQSNGLQSDTCQTRNTYVG